MLFCDNNMHWILASYQQLLSDQANVHSIKVKAMHQLLLNARMTSTIIQVILCRAKSTAQLQILIVL